MYPLRDKDLDRLSRNAAEHYEMDFGPSGWEQLEKRLDQELPQQRDRRRFLFWLFFIVVTTGSALTGLLINSQPVAPLAVHSITIPPANRIDAAGNNTATGQTGSAGNISDRSTALTPPDNDSGKAEPNASSNIQHQPTANTGTPAPASGIQTNTAGAVARRLHANGNTLSRQPNRIKQAGSATGSRPITKAGNRDDQPVTNDKNDNSSARSNDLAAAPDENISAAPQPPLAQPATVTANTSITKTAATTDSSNTPASADPAKDAAPEKKTPSEHGLELGLVAGPDATSIAFGPMHKAGYNVGVQAGYRFSDRWSVTIGVIYTGKSYKADSQYFKPKEPLTRYGKLDDLKGTCSMFDIPVNVRYDISFTNKRRFFVSTGISTYIMDNQRYKYNLYYYNNNTPYPKDTSYPNNYSYLFGVLNFSAGFERAIGGHFSIQAEPYLKIPLKGMGYGNMKMNSYGIYFSLKYKPQFGSKRSTIHYRPLGH